MMSLIAESIIFKVFGCLLLIGGGLIGGLHLAIYGKKLWNKFKETK